MYFGIRLLIFEVSGLGLLCEYNVENCRMEVQARMGTPSSYTRNHVSTDERTDIIIDHSAQTS